VVHQAGRDAVLAGHANAVQVELIALQERVGAGAETRTGGADSAARQDDGRVGRVVEVRVEVRLAVILFIGVRNTIPAHAQVQGQFRTYLPVVLSVERRGLVVPVAFVLERRFLVLTGVAQQEIGEVVAGVLSVESEAALSQAEYVLDLLVDGPACAELELVTAFGPGKIVADLVVVGLIRPRHAVHIVGRTRRTTQEDGGDAVQGVDRKQFGDIPAGRLRIYRARQRQNEDAVAVVVEGDFIEYRGTHGIDGVDHAAVGGVAEGVGGCRNVVAAPHRGPVSLQDRLVHPMAEDPELVGEVMVDADNLLADIGRRIVAAGERGAAGWRRENAGLQQKLGVGGKQRSGDLVTGERLKDRVVSRIDLTGSRAWIGRAEGLAGCGELTGELRGDLVRTRRMRTGADVATVRAG